MSRPGLKSIRLGRGRFPTERAKADIASSGPGPISSGLGPLSRNQIDVESYGSGPMSSRTTRVDVESYGPVPMLSRTGPG